MEMYAGSRSWVNGVVAGLNCDEILASTRVPVPEALKGLLKQCLSSDQRNRPNHFGFIEEKLLELYEAETESKYPRAASKAAEHMADSLNNKALSYLDLGMEEEARNCWEQVLNIMPDHVETIFNQTIWQWRCGEIDPWEALRILSIKIKNPAYYRAKFQIALGDAESVLRDLNRAELEDDQLIDKNVMLAKAQQIIKKKNENTILTHEMEMDKECIYCFSPDGVIIFKGKVGVKLWDALTGICIYKEYMNKVCFAEGKMVISDYYSYYKLWDIESRRCISEIESDHDYYNNNNIWLGPDGKIMLACKQEGDLWGSRLMRRACQIEKRKFEIRQFVHKIGNWNVESGELVTTECGVFVFQPSGISLDGKMQIVAENKCLKLWNLESGEHIRDFDAHESEVCSVCFSSDGDMIISGDNNDTLKFWDVISGKCIRTVKSFTKKIRISLDGKTVITERNNSIMLWNITTKECVCALNLIDYFPYKDTIFTRAFLSFGFSPDAKTISVSRRDKEGL